MTILKPDEALVAEYMHDLRERVSVMGSGTMDRADPLADNAEWLKVPARKRVVALARHHVLTDYDAERTRTKADAETAAARMGVKLRSFYSILKHWRDNGRTPLKLVTNAPGTGERRSRLETAVAERLISLTRDAVNSDPSAPMKDLVSMVRRNWGKASGLPTDVTIRTYIDRALGEKISTPDTISNDPFNKDEPLHEPITRFGQALVVDHTAPAKILVDENEALAPTITLAIDLHTGTPLGASVYDSYPNGDGVIEAVEQAMRRLQQLMHGTDVAPPTIIFKTTFDLEWRGLSEELAQKGHPTIEHTSGTLSNGEPIRRALGSMLGDITLQSTKAIRRRSEDDENDLKAILALDEAQIVIQDALNKAFLARVPTDAAEQLATPKVAGSVGRTKTLMRRKGTGPDNLETMSSRWPGTDNQRAIASLRGRIVPERLSYGHPRGARSPRIFERHLNRLARDVAHDSFVAVKIDPPNDFRHSWDVEVEVDDDNVRPIVWLELARLATNFHDLEGTLVQFTVVTSSST